jgi:hypothetical protein
MKHLAPMLLLASFVSLTGIACGGSSSPAAPSSSNTVTSGSASGSSSHNAGRDCASCHNFVIAGTAYKADGVTVNPGVVIKVTSGAGGTGTALATLTADRSGNFYSSSAVGFGAGAYVSGTNASGGVTAMTAAITSGACNRCHTTGSRLIVN